jgi:hypothetical protein
MYKVWIKRNFREIQSIGEGTYRIVVERLYGIVLALAFRPTGYKCFDSCHRAFGSEESKDS